MNIPSITNQDQNVESNEIILNETMAVPMNTNIANVIVEEGINEDVPLHNIPVCTGDPVSDNVLKSKIYAFFW